ncbi:MAG: DNA gyrase inhibitor YacG [Porticoccus sp.]|nr:DNA gyrase inhibitor YacG [Porticoccus sp.]
MNTQKTATIVNCPTCKKSVAWGEQSPFRPFCSKRCQEVDFGDWASENFSIPGAPAILDALDDEDIIQH